MKRVAIVQSNYLPWKGYFDLIASVDEVILLDDVQFTRRDWRNRNRIKTPHGLQWLTVPVNARGRFQQKIRDTEIAPGNWAEGHWRAIECNYRRSPHFHDYAPALQRKLCGNPHGSLSALNRNLLELCCEFLGISTPLTNSWDYIGECDDRNERLAAICTGASASVYVSGPAAQGYLDESLFATQGIAVEWFDYRGYPEYQQLWGGFIHEVSIIDLLFNCGNRAPDYLRRIRPCGGP